MPCVINEMVNQKNREGTSVFAGPFAWRHPMFKTRNDGNGPGQTRTCPRISTETPISELRGAECGADFKVALCKLEEVMKHALHLKLEERKWLAESLHDSFDLLVGFKPDNMDE